MLLKDYTVDKGLKKRDHDDVHSRISDNLVKRRRLFSLNDA